MLFIIKIVISGLLIAFVSWFAGKNPKLAGFLTALPLTSLIALTWMYFQYRDMDKLNEYAVSIFVAVPVSLLFFIPFITNRWLKWSLTPTFLSGFFLLGLGYFAHQWVMKALFKT